MKTEYRYFVYDMRYLGDPDRAVVFTIEDTRDEAFHEAEQHGGGVVVMATIEDDVVVSEMIVATIT